jgi:hypothetical protein
MTFPNELALHISSIFLDSHKICNPNPWNIPFSTTLVSTYDVMGFVAIQPAMYTTMIYVCTIAILHTHCTMSFFTWAYLFHPKCTLLIIPKSQNRWLLKNAQKTSNIIF